MAEKKVGALVKEARTAAGLTQEKLAQKVGGGLTAAEISQCEREKADLTTAQLKKIAVACGVTQASLINAPRNLETAKTAGSGKKTGTAAKTAEAKKTETKTSTARKTEAKTGTAKKSAAKTSTAKISAAKTPAGANTSMKVTATEKKLVEAYRSAGSDEKKIALKVLKGEYGDKVTSLLNLAGGSVSGAAADGISDAIGSLLSGLLGGK